MKHETPPHHSKTLKTPVGKLTLVANETHLLAILWENEREGRVKIDRGTSTKLHPVLNQVEIQLQEYFAGKRTQFDLPIRFQGTEFQNKVWKHLQKIPFGKTMSYGELAAKIGSPKASRAVGAANGKNPISIVVPCHRVIGMNGKLTGFAGGLKEKEILLDLEK